MSAHVYKTIEVTGSSARGSDDAVVRAIAKAAETVRHMDWFEVIETRGHLAEEAIAHWQVTVKIGFRMD